MEPIITPLPFTYKKTDTDVWVFNLEELPFDQMRIQDRQIVHFGPQSVGGNHKHSRIEWFVAIGELVFVWLDEQGQKHEQEMNPDGQLFLFEVPPYLPHAVVNRSLTDDATLMEMADGKMTERETVEVV